MKMLLTKAISSDLRFHSPVPANKEAGTTWYSVSAEIWQNGNLEKEYEEGSDDLLVLNYPPENCWLFCHALFCLVPGNYYMVRERHLLCSQSCSTRHSQDCWCNQLPPFFVINLSFLKRLDDGVMSGSYMQTLNWSLARCSLNLPLSQTSPS